MTSTDTVYWLHKAMQCSISLRFPVAGCSDWPSPSQADPPELKRSLDDADVRRALELAHRRGVADRYIAAVWNAVVTARQAGETENWIADLIDILDNLQPTEQ